MEQINGVLSPIGSVSGSVSNFGWDMSGPLAYLGVDAKHLGKVFEKSYKLKDTAYDTWAGSTTAKVIVTSETLSPTVALDMEKYEYFLMWLFKYKAAFNQGATLKVTPDVEAQSIYQSIFKRPSSLANVDSENFNGNTVLTLYTAPYMCYYNSSGVKTLNWSASYGFYAGATAPTFSSSTSDTPTLTIKTPTISSRCSTTYFATGRVSEVDKNATTMWMEGHLYRVNKGAFTRGAFGELVKVVNNGN